TTVFRLSQTGAQALALTMIIPGIFVALFTYALHGQVDWLAGPFMALGSIFLVPYGVRLAYALPDPRLKLTFACMPLVIMVLVLLKACFHAGLLVVHCSIRRQSRASRLALGRAAPLAACSADRRVGGDQRRLPGRQGRGRPVARRGADAGR